MDTLKLSKNGEKMSLGPGSRWGDVFSYLEFTNKTVIEGRLVMAVLADGTIATVSANNSYSDLNWALGGGGNIFALIARFDLQTFPPITPLLADAHYGSTNETRDAYLATVLNMALHNDEDLDATTIPVARWGPKHTALSYESTLFYNNTSAPTSGPLAEYIYGNTTGLRALNGSATLRPVSLAQYGHAIRSSFRDGGQSHGLRQKFRVVSITATAEALRIMHDTYFDTLKASGLANKTPEFFTGLAFKVVNRNMAKKSLGLPQNIPLESAFRVDESITWGSSGDFDREIENWVKSANREIEAKPEAIDGLSRCLYLNDADKGQKVFESYGGDSVARLKEIRAKYDPDRVYTDLMPSGWKLIMLVLSKTLFAKLGWKASEKSHLMTLWMLFEQ